MGKGGSVDTGPMRAAAQAALGYGAEAASMGRELYQQGRDIWSTYGSPTYNALLQMAGWGPGGGGQYISPLQSKFMQAPMLAGQQAAGAASRSLKNMGLGPVATQVGQQQIDLSRMANIETSAAQLQQWVAQQLGAAGTTGLSLASQQPSTILGAGNVALGAGGIEAQIAQMQMQAAAANNLGLSGIFKTIGTLGGLALGGPFGGAMGGALFGGGGGSSGGGGGGGYMTPTPLGSWGQTVWDIPLNY